MKVPRWNQIRSGVPRCCLLVSSLLMAACGSQGGASRETVAAPSINPAGGHYRHDIEVTLGTVTEGATIRYVLDGTIPTTGSLRYDGPIHLEASALLRTRAFAEGREASSIVGEDYDIVLNEPPVLLPIEAQSTYEGKELTFQVAASDPDSAPPGLRSPALPVGASFEDQGNGRGVFQWTPTEDSVGVHRVKFIAIDAEDALLGDTIEVVITVHRTPVLTAPGIQPESDSYFAPIEVSLGTSTDGTTLYYTLDGSRPDADAIRYDGPFTVARTAEVRAVEIIEGFPPSADSRAVFALPDELPHYWRFNGDLADSVGGSVASCDVRCPEFDTGIMKQGVWFDGSTTGLVVLEGPGVDWQITDGVTVELWMRADSCVGRQAVVGWHSKTQDAGWWTGCEDGNAVFQLTAAGGDQALALVSDKRVDDGRWHHVAVAHDPHIGEYHLYVDGDLEGVDEVNGTSGFEAAVFMTIGWLDAGQQRGAHFRGTLDELALHRRVLSRRQIASHWYDGTIGLHNGVWGCNNTPVRIMPLGDSITRRPGYRERLYTDLWSAGYPVDFVGTRGDPCGESCSYDDDNEGHSGYTASDLAVGLPGWLSNTRPDVVLLHIGSNEDPVYPYPDVTSVDSVLDVIDGYDAKTSVILARIINNATHNPLISEFNKNLAGLAATKALAGGRYSVADHENALDYSQDMADELHPNASGYGKMSDVWFEALRTFLPACQPTPPTIISNPDTSVPSDRSYTYRVDATGHPTPHFSLERAPSGMDIHPDTGVLEWTHPVPGDYEIVVQVKNTLGKAEQGFSLRVR